MQQNSRIELGYNSESRARSGQCIKRAIYAIRTAESESKVWQQNSNRARICNIGESKVWAMYKKSSITVGYAIRTAESEGRSGQCIKRAV